MGRSPPTHAGGAAIGSLITWIEPSRDCLRSRLCARGARRAPGASATWDDCSPEPPTFRKLVFGENKKMTEQESFALPGPPPLLVRKWGSKNRTMLEAIRRSSWIGGIICASMRSSDATARRQR